jgi:uncharacterized protein (TIGR02391 family)
VSTPASDQLAIGQELSAEQRRVVQVVYDLWNPELLWPHSNSVDRILDRQHNIDIAQVLPTIPDRYISYNRVMPTDTEIRLTIAGISCCEGGDGDVALFLRALRWCVEREKTYEPPPSKSKEELRLSTEDARSDWARDGGEASPRILTKAFALITVEYVAYGGPTGNADEWAFSLNRNVRNYRGATTLTDYLAIKERLRTAAPSPVVYSGRRMTRRSSAGYPAPLGSALDGLGTSLVPSLVDAEELPTLTLEDLHPLVADACRDLFAGGHYRQGVHDAFLAFRDLVRQLTGLPDDNDSTLMGKAFGGDHPRLLVVNDLADKNDKNVQQGMAHLSAGLCAFVRNPLAHKSEQIEPAQAMRMVALVDMLVRKVEDRPGASPPPQSPMPSKSTDAAG